MRNTTSNKANDGRSRAAVSAQYSKLLAEFAPVAVETEAENERALGFAAALMNKPGRSAAETALLKLLGVLIEDFEQKRYSMGESDPVEVLKELMRGRGMTAKDLWPIFGSKGITSEVLNGKRGISKEMARKLAEALHVPPAVFI